MQLSKIKAALSHLARQRISLMIICLCAAMTGCASTSQPANVSSLRAIVGTHLVGAKGATKSDQTKIDRTVARLCGSGIYSTADCRRHTE